MKNLRPIWKWAGFYLCLGLLAVGILTVPALRYFNRQHSGEPLTYGVSFSVKYAEELGLDWREAYLAILGDLGVKRVRLMSYWDRLQPLPGVYEWEELDWQMDHAAAHGTKVSLAIGLRQPRYPECHYPSWYQDLNMKQRSEALQHYLAQVVQRYQSHPALASWQLENEALNEGFGVCHRISARQLKSEFGLVKNLDRVHPVIISLSDEGGLPLRAPRGDLAGFSVYQKFWMGGWVKRYTKYPLTPSWHTWRAAVIEYYLGRPVMIHELQAEPWGPVATRDLSAAEQDKTMDIEQLKYMFDYSAQTGIKTVDLWGAEWWYWRKQKFDDPRFWNLAKEVL